MAFVSPASVAKSAGKILTHAAFVAGVEEAPPHAGFGVSALALVSAAVATVLFAK